VVKSVRTKATYSADMASVARLQIGVLEEKLAKQKKLDSDSYHRQKFALNMTNAKVMKETSQQLIAKKKVPNFA